MSLLIKDDIKNEQVGTFKKLRNQLAKIFHPDTLDEKSAKEFKEIQTAFEEGNFTKLIDKAIENDIDIKMSDSDSMLLKSIIDKQREFISSKSQTAEWLWYYSDRKYLNRVHMWSAMGINKENFESWVLEQGFSASSMEAECQARLKAHPRVENVAIKKKTRRRKTLLITS